MIFIGLGANLPTETYGPPRAALGAALEALQGQGPVIRQHSPWYESAPVPVSDQPWYVNGVCRIETTLTAQQLVALLLDLETRFGRLRSVQNAPRILDMDLLAYNDLVLAGSDPSALSVPHPRMYGRAFVILPLADIAPDWVDPVSGKAICDLRAALPEDQQTRPMADAHGLFGTEWPGQAGE
ncbi:MAG: 2-amino-4-hydroxy-6-hydroxymethyldihydropteridine diphosphokinase [Rhodospirillales bacterium]|nr:2-amino-4-hydroxy-6-hydroxymethyldihydropteridine diphosphokinase [Rhodospirillales bacterium]